MSSIVESWIYGQGDSQSGDVLREARHRFEEAITLVNIYHPEAVTSKDFIAMIDRGLGHFDRFDHAVSYTMDQAIQSSIGPRMGLGIITDSVEEGVFVGHVVPGSPGWHSGLRSGDIVRVGSNPDLFWEKVDNFEPGSPGVDVEVIRDGMSLPLSLVPADFSMPSVFDYGVEEGVLHVVVSGFLPGMAEQAREIIDAHYGNIDGVIVDLRNNGGGLVEEAVGLLEDFLPVGVRAFSSKGRVGGALDFVMETPERWPGLKVSVLQNGYSASCSELLAGSLKEAGRATVVGWPSVGKASIQRAVDSRYGGGYRVTLAKYTVGEGVSIDGIGVVPDIALDWKDPLSRPAFAGIDKAKVVAQRVLLDG